MTSDSLPLAGKVALVTGSSRNIGRSIALSLAEKGASVQLAGQSDEEAIKSVAEEIETLGRKVSWHLADIAREDEADRLVERAIDTFGQLDILVLNAAIRRQSPIADISTEDWRAVLGVALDGAFFMSRAAVPHLIQSEAGRIVGLGGTSSIAGSKNRAHVSAAKMGLVGLLRVLATELGEHGVTANCVAAGHVDTARGAAAGQRSAGGTNRPITRMATVEEIASAVSYLCLPEAAYITGQTLHVNGGMAYYGN